MKEIISRIYSDTKESYLKIVEDDLKKKRKKFIITVNPESIMLSLKDKELETMLNDKAVSLTPDGIAVVKAAKSLGVDISERITGIDITEFLFDIANRSAYSMYLFGATNEVITKLKEKIKEDYPNINLLGVTDGYVDNKDEVMKKIIKLEPDIVILAMGIPMQEKLIYKHIGEANKGIFIGVGGSFDVLSGTKRRAPKIFIKLNLEWLYRICKEPKRLKRFYQSNIKFMLKVKKENKKTNK